MTTTTHHRTRLPLLSGTCARRRTISPVTRIHSYTIQSS